MHVHFTLYLEVDSLLSHLQISRRFISQKHLLCIFRIGDPCMIAEDPNNQQKGGPELPVPPEEKLEWIAGHPCALLLHSMSMEMSKSSQVQRLSPSTGLQKNEAAVNMHDQHSIYTPPHHMTPVQRIGGGPSSGAPRRSYIYHLSLKHHPPFFMFKPAGTPA